MTDPKPATTPDEHEVDAAADGPAAATVPPESPPGAATSAPPPAAPAAAGPHYLSIVAFTLGLAGVVAPGLPSLAAIVLGHIALTREPTGRTFAIIGLVAGYVVVGVFIIGMIIFFSIWGVVLASIFSALPAMDVRMG